MEQLIQIQELRNITAIKQQVSMLYPDTIVEEAVSSTIVRKHMQEKEHINAKSPLEALISLKEQDVTQVCCIFQHT